MARSVPTAPGAPSPGPAAVAVQACPIQTTLGALGRKWTLTILRDIAFFPDASFTLILKNNPRLRQRTLSLRLKQLRAQGLIAKTPGPNGGRRPTYRLSPTGLQVWPILATLAQFGFQNYAEQVFADGRPRELEEVFPNGVDLMLGRFSTRPPRPSRPARAAIGSGVP
jgi:DNA-binding HxlR family transcriptional regulator